MSTPKSSTASRARKRDDTIYPYGDPEERYASAPRGAMIIKDGRRPRVAVFTETMIDHASIRSLPDTAFRLLIVLEIHSSGITYKEAARVLGCRVSMIREAKDTLKSAKVFPFAVQLSDESNG